MPSNPFTSRRVPWHTPLPILKRRQHLARLKRKGLLPSPTSHARSPAEQAQIDLVTRDTKPVVR